MPPAHSAASAPRFATAVEVSPSRVPRRRSPPALRGSPDTKSYLPTPARHTRWLLGLFVLSLALMNPWVRGDGVGYYAFARALLIQHNLDFTPDYNAANASFRDARLDENGKPETGVSHCDESSRKSFHRWACDSVGAISDRRACRRSRSLARLDRASPRMDSRRHIGLRWRSEPRCTDSSVCCWRCDSRRNMSASAGRSSRRSRSGGRVRFPCTCISIRRGRMRIPRSWSRCSSGIGTKRARRAARCNGSCSRRSQGLMLNVYYPNAMVLAVLVVEAVPQYFAALRQTIVCTPSQIEHNREAAVCTDCLRRIMCCSLW